NSEPSPPLQGNYFPETQKDLKICEANHEKSSVNEPPELELKDLPPHLEYAFLEGDDKLPIIIAKDLKDEEKAALIEVLKSHKRAIAWKLSNIKGINPEFCTHKILIEEDYEPMVQHERRVNPKIYNVIKKEVEKLLDAGLIYPISDSPWGREYALTIENSYTELKDLPPDVELKDLPPHLEYAFLEGNDKLPVIIAKDLKNKEKEALIEVLKSHKRVIAWKLSDIKGIDPEFCTHKILMEEDYEPTIQHQRRVNPKIHDVIKKEVEKLLDAGLIYPISDSPWVSPIHCVPKKGGITVIKNDDNELIPTRLVTGWRVCIDYRC
ncbi:hypothetical protein Tco_1574145, partial [Tanacetum coccineum]